MTFLSSCILFVVIFGGILNFIIDKFRYKLPPGPLPIPFIGKPFNIPSVNFFFKIQNIDQVLFGHFSNMAMSLLNRCV